MASVRPTGTAKGAISVSDMARALGVSRTHLHALIKNGIMPSPVYDLRTRRPFFTAELQQVCRQVRDSNIGFDGSYVLFYAARAPRSKPMTTARNAQGASQQRSDLLEGLRALGMPGVSPDRLGAALAVCYPNGTDGSDEGTVLRTLWTQLRRQDAV